MQKCFKITNVKNILTVYQFFRGDYSGWGIFLCSSHNTGIIFVFLHVWDVGKVNSDHYILMSTLGLGNFPIYDDSIKSQCVYHSSSKKYLYCPVAKLNEEINTISFSSLETPVIKRSVFIPTIEEAENGGTLGMTAQDQAFQDNGSFWIDGSVNIHAYTTGAYGYRLMSVQMIGQAANFPTIKSFYRDTNTPIPAGNRISYAMATNSGKAIALGLRPYISMFNKDIVFAAAPKYTNGALHAYSMTTGPGMNSGW